jgi:hypothetical protein
LAATRVRVSSGRSAAAAEIVAATTAAGARIAAVDVPIAAGAPAARDSNAVPAARGMTVAIKAVIPVHRAGHN